MTCTVAQLRMILSTAIALALVTEITLAQHASAAQPSPDFTVSPQPPVAGQVTTFTATGLRGSDFVQWDFERDGIIDATGTTAQWVYPTAGPRTVLMRVRRGGDDPREVLKTVFVQAAPTPPQPPPQPPPPPAEALLLDVVRKE